MESTVVKNEILVGSFLALAVVLGAVWASKRSRDKGLLDVHRIHFTVPKGSGLQKGAPVLMRGIEVGSIGDVELTADRKVRVTAEIAPRFARYVTEDTLASVIEPPFLGTTKVQLEPGEGEQGGRDVELSTSELPSFMARIDSLEVDVKELLKRVDKLVQNADATLEDVRSVTKKVDEGKGLVGRLLNDEQLADDVEATLTDVRAVVKEIREGEGALAMAVNDEKFAADLKASAENLREVSDEISEGKGSLGRLVKDAQLVDESTGLVKDVRGSLGKLNELNEQAKKSMERVERLLASTEVTVRKINDLVESGDDVTKEIATSLRKINSGKGTIAALLNDDAVYRETRSLLKELRESVEDLREQAPINSFIGVVFSAF